MFSKRGISQADWIISIGIFILYLAWFFVVIGPALNIETKETLPADSLKDRFMLNASWQVNVTPVIIRSDASTLPVIMDFPYPGSTQNYAIKETYWSMQDNRIMFLASFSDSKVLYSLIHSDHDYVKPSVSSNLESSDEAVTSGDLQVTFDQGLIDKARYSGLKIVDFSMEVDGNPISTDQDEYSSDEIVARYKVRTPSINNTVYIFENSTSIYGYIDTLNEKTVTLDLVLHEYDNYFVDSSDQGSIKYNQTECDHFETDYIDFTDNDGLAFEFSDDVNIIMCHDNILELQISKIVDGSFDYRIIFHDKDVDAHDLIYTSEFGVANIYEGLSSQKMLDIRNSDYTAMKDYWNIDNDFNITVYNDTGTFLRFGLPPYSRTNVHSEEYYVWILDENSERTRAKINILFW